jgi:hypothetical protein
MDRKGDSVTLPKWHNLSTALHARPLFCQDELATCEVLAGPGEENRDLERECEIAIQILMETVEITRNILQQRCWARLTCVVHRLRNDAWPSG